MELNQSKHTHDEVTRASIYMRERGGSFDQAIGKALQVADHDNLNRLKSAFPELIERYVRKYKPLDSENE